MKIKVVLMLIYLLVVDTNIIFSQTKLNIDSLIKKFEDNPINEEKYGLAVTISGESNRANPQLAVEYLNKAGALANMLNDNAIFANYFKTKGINKFILNQMDSAELFFLNSIKYAYLVSDSNRNRIIKVSTEKLASFYIRNNRYNEGLAQLLKVVNLQNEKNPTSEDYITEYNIYTVFIHIYINLNKYEEVKYYAFKELDLAKNKLKLDLFIGISYGEIGRVLIKNKEERKGLLYLDTSILYLKKSPKNTIYEQTIMKTVKSEAYFYLNQFDSSILFSKEAYQLAFENNITPAQFPIIQILIKNYTNLHNKDSCYKYLEKIKNYISIYKSTKHEIEIFEELAMSYNSFKNYDSSTKYYDLTIETMRSLDEAEINDATINYLKKYETVEKEKQIAEQKLELNQKQLQNVELEKTKKLESLRFEYEKKQQLTKSEFEKKQLIKEEATKRQKIESDAEFQKQILMKESELFQADLYKKTLIKDNLIAEQKLSLSNQKNWKIIFASIAGLFLLTSFFAFLRYRAKQKMNETLTIKNDKIEVLIKELHHRVKNNMQVISSLLSLQNNDTLDSDSKKVLQEGQNRVQAMGLIHQKLYLNENISEVNMKDYIETLIENLVQSYRIKKVKVIQDVQPLMLNIDTALPLGLIINELVTNAFKYGCNKDNPELFISLLQVVNSFELKLKDNGNYSEGEYNLNNSTSFGLKLVKTLVKQINGTIKCSTETGTEYTLKIAQ